MNILAYGGVTLQGRLDDIALMHYLLDPEKSHKTDVLAQSVLGVSLDAVTNDAVPSTGSLFDDIPSDEVNRDRSKEAAVLLLLAERIRKDMEEASVTSLYDTMEEPLLKVLSKMERNGVRVDLGSLKDFTEHLRQEMLEREARIREMAGDPSLNISSPKQVGTVLFEKLKLSDKPKKNNNGTYSTE